MATTDAIAIVCMGVSASGKSTLARALADALGGIFIEGDDLHPGANVEKMRRGEPLTDEDRAPWLATVADALAGCRQRGERAVVSCSALRRRYRDRLRADDPDLRLVYLRASRELLERRLQRRRDHFMPASLLDSQLETLEPPQADENAVTVDIDGRDASEILEAALAALATLSQEHDGGS